MFYFLDVMDFTKIKVGQVGRALAEIIKPFIAGCRLNSGNSLNLACANNWLQLKLLFPCTLHILFNIFKDILKLVHCSCHCAPSADYDSFTAYSYCNTVTKA